MIEHADVVEPDGRVLIGSHVTVRHPDGELETYELVARGEAAAGSANMYVQHAMSTSVVVVNPEEPAARAADLLVDRSLTGLPVVDAQGYAVGVVSDLDLISVLRHGIDLYDTTVSWRRAACSSPSVGEEANRAGLLLKPLAAQ